MFDLHLHTLLSDGSLTTPELLDMLRENDIRWAAITDHNHAMAYETMTPHMCEGIRILPGCEMASNYKGYVIEILGLGIDAARINAWHRRVFNDEAMKNNELHLFHALKERCIQNTIILDDDLAMAVIEKGVSKKIIYYDMIKRNANLPFAVDSYRDFFRLELANPASKLFINEAALYPSIEEVVALIHDAGGKCFLAHPYEYGMPDVSAFLEDLSHSVDGIEVLHPSCALTQSNRLIDFCEAKGLLASGGSDFHRAAKLIRCGVRTSKQLLMRKPFVWMQEHMALEELL